MKGRTAILRYAVTLLVIIALVGISASAAEAEDDPGVVYVLTNQTANSVLVFARAADGTLSFSGNFATGGAGAGTGVDPLGSQSSLVLRRARQQLFAVNADALPARPDVMLEVAENGIVFQQMRERGRAGEIVHGDIFNARIAQRRAEQIAANAAKTINANFDCHLRNPPKQSNGL